VCSPALGEHDSPTEMIQELSRRLDGQTGSLHQADDLTMLCMHAGALTAAPTRSAPATTVKAAPPAAA